MQKTFKDTRILDSAVRTRYGLSEPVMMENAAYALEKAVRSVSGAKSVLIVCGAGNNGADGYALARRLVYSSYDIFLFPVVPPKSNEAVNQKKRLDEIVQSVQNSESTVFKYVDTNVRADIIVDCIFGSGFHGMPDERVSYLIDQLNGSDSFKIACDVPSCLTAESNCKSFDADVTVTMGALKNILYCENAKDFCGKIICEDLGVSRNVFELSAEPEETYDAMVLELSDLKLPHRTKHNVNKGSFGHTVVVCGEKKGAAVIASKAAFSFGSGLVTLAAFSADNEAAFDSLPYEIMFSKSFPQKASSIAVGMGLGGLPADVLDFLLHRDVPAVIDADLCHYEGINQILRVRSDSKFQTVITPHPKEFSDLWYLCTNENLTVSQIQSNRIDFVKKFCTLFPNVVLLLKGCIPIIGFNEDGKSVELYLNPIGSPCLAKGGSGDVLSGLIASLLAQGVNTKEAAINASLAHSAASCKIKNDYAMTPFDLIEAVCNL